MLPDFPEVKARLLRLVSMDYRRQINADNLIGQISAMPYFEGERFSNGDVEGYIEVPPAEIKMIPYEIERAAILREGTFAFVKSLQNRCASPSRRTPQDAVSQTWRSYRTRRETTRCAANATVVSRLDTSTGRVYF